MQHIKFSDYLKTSNYNRDNDRVHDYISTYPLLHEQGYTGEELEFVLNEIKSNFPDFNQSKFDDNMMGNTCMVIDGKAIMYYWDVSQAMMCGLEDRNLRIDEWD